MPTRPADLGLEAVPVGLERLGGDVAEGDGQAVELRERAGQQAVLEGEGGAALLLEQPGVVDGQRDPGRDGADEVAVEPAVVGLLPGGEPGQREGEHAQQLAAGAQRRGDGRAEPDLLGDAG
jgi:hypothetical protein